MLPEPRTFMAGDRKLIVRLTLGSVLTITRRYRSLLAEHGIANIFGPGSEKFFAALAGEGSLSSIEADAIFACAVLAENKPEIGINEYIELTEQYPGLADVIEQEVKDFFLLKARASANRLGLTEEQMSQFEAAISGQNSEPPPFSRGESEKTNFGEAQHETYSPSTPDARELVGV